MDAKGIESNEQELQRRRAKCYDDPVAWAYWAFDWLAPWQEEELRAQGEANQRSNERT